MSVYDFLLTVASQLGDAKPNAPFRRYPLRDLVAFYKEAMCFVATHRPDLFTEFVVMKLDTGAQQDARCGCGCINVLGFVAQIDANGNTIKDLTSTGGTAKKTSKWYRPVCKKVTNPDGTTSITTLIDGIYIEPGMNGSFTVSPPIPPGVDVWVKLKCSRGPADVSEADVLDGASTGDCQFLPAIRSYVLYRALQGDRHAAGAAGEAQNEFRNVHNYLKIQLAAEQLVEKQ